MDTHDVSTPTHPNRARCTSCGKEHDCVPATAYGRRDLDDPDVIGVQINGKWYHPADVNIVRVRRDPA
jgi:hypothetical protein